MVLCLLKNLSFILMEELVVLRCKCSGKVVVLVKQKVVVKVVKVVVKLCKLVKVCKVSVIVEEFVVVLLMCVVWDDWFILVVEMLLWMGGMEVQLVIVFGCEIEDIVWWCEEYFNFDVVFGKCVGFGICGGRLMEYDLKFVVIVKKLGEFGVMDLEVVQVFEVMICIIYCWKFDYFEFFEVF